MLVLSRKRNESILLDKGRIRVTCVEIQGSKVRIGIEAPDEVDVVREEIQHQTPPDRRPPRAWSGEGARRA